MLACVGFFFWPTAAADVWAFGVTLLTITAGVFPWEAANPGVLQVCRPLQSSSLTSPLNVCPRVVIRCYHQATPSI